MIAIQVHLWPDCAVVLNEESPGHWRRLAGDCFGEDGSLPLLAATLGKENYVGASAAAIAYEYPRATLSWLPYAGSAHDRQQLLGQILRCIAETVSRRFAQETLGWHVVADEAYSREEIAWACWEAGIPESHISDLSGIASIALTNHPPVPGQSLLMIFRRGGHAVTRLAVSQATGWMVVDEFLSSTVLGDPYSLPGPLNDAPEQSPRTAAGLRLQLQYDARSRAIMTDRKCLSGMAAVMDSGAWCLRSAARGRIVEREDAFWRAYAGECRSYMDTLGDYRVDGCLLFETGQRAFAKRFECFAQEIFRQRLSLSVVAQAEELWAGGLAVPAAVLDAELVLALAGEQDNLADHKTIAPKGAALPFRSDHLVYLQRTLQHTLCLKLSKIDSLLGRPYSYASHTIHLRGDMRRNTAVHLKVTVFQSGLVALDISVPEYQFNEQVVLGAKREPIANAPGPQGDGVPDARWQGRLGSAVDGLPSMTA